MATVTRELKRKLGDAIVKLKKDEFGSTPEEVQIARILESKGLTKYYGPDQQIASMRVEDANRYLQMAAMSRFVLTGLGEEMLLSYTEAQLQRGSFLLPGELAWYDSWPWKLLWPAIVSVVTTLIVTAIRG